MDGGDSSSPRNYGAGGDAGIEYSTEQMNEQAYLSGKAWVSCCCILFFFLCFCFRCCR